MASGVEKRGRIGVAFLADFVVKGAAETGMLAKADFESGAMCRFTPVGAAEYVNVGNARHMVAGDRNDQFSAAVLSFIGRLSAAKASPSTGKRPGKSLA